MKVAYCFSGMLRELNSCGPKWKEIIDKNPGDVYGHFWNKYDKSELDTVSNFNQIFNPVKVETEDFEVFKETALNIMLTNINPPSSLEQNLRNSVLDGRLISMYYKIWRANQLSLCQNYDVIVRCRTDFYPDVNIKIEKNDYVNIPVGDVLISDWTNSDGPLDLFAYGNRTLMNYYSSLYLYIMKYLYQGYYCSPNEHMLKVHLSHKDLSIRRMPINVYSYTHTWYNSYTLYKEKIESTSTSFGVDKNQYAYVENKILN